MRGAGIQHAVHAVAHAHDFFLPRQLVLNVGVHPVLRAYFLEHFNHALIGAPMKRPLQRADGRGDGGIHVRKRGDADARRKGGGIHAVVCVQNVGYLQNMGFILIRFLTLQQPQEMFRLAQVLPNGGKLQTLAQTVVIRHHHGNLGYEAEAYFLQLPGILRPVVIHAEHGNSRPEGGHGPGGLGGRFEEIQNGLGQVAVGTEAFLDALQFLTVGKTLVEKQINHFFKTAHLHQIIDIVAQIQQTPFLAAHVTQSGFIGDDSF